MPMTHNSPMVAGRIVAVALFANNEINDAELFALHRVQVCDRLGLSRDNWHALLDETYEAFLSSRRRTRSAVSDLLPVQHWLGLIDDPVLQQQVARMCAAVIISDGFVEPGEARLLQRMLAAWSLPHEDRELLEALIYGLDFEIRPRSDLGTVH
ncbi:hypothetical protein GTZ97_10850 [Aquabacterium fontiphilum]|jgi:hypothetical protein|uniref:hypothetical protein n=1 Tax=Aquabacterium fontiphilum TaxID=450365 RepID=UPI001377C5E1|nr:hypothetical protein [Aquabacterium fontiphilum]NBD21162.1 hypothetical protein [Aquabacterium fontiphilum]